MASTKLTSTLLFVLFGCFSVCLGGDFCTTSDDWSSGSWNYDTTYCVYGCCGYYPNQYCCSYSVGVIVGGVFGAIASICLLVALICCCVRSGQRGRIITTSTAQPWSTGTVAVVSNNTNNTQFAGYGYGQPMAGQPAPPPPYSAAPAYGYPNPAYPPAGTGEGYGNPGFKP